MTTRRTLDLLFVLAAAALLLILVLFCVASPTLAQHEDDQAEEIPADENTEHSDPSVQVLTSQNFDLSIASGGKWFVKFYAPWCPHCKSLVPEWEKTAKKLNSEQIHIAKVDCTVNEDLCTKYGIQGFPTLKLIDSDTAIEYNGPRTAAAFENFVQRMSGPTLISIADSQQLDSFMSKEETAFVFFGGAEDSKEKTAIEAAVQPFRASFEFAHAASPALAAKATEMGASSLPAFVSRTPDATFVYDGAWESDQITSWISTHRFGLLPELSPQNFQELTKMGKPIVMVVLQPKTQSDVTKKMQNLGREVARNFFNSFLFSWIDGETWNRYIEGTYQIKPDQLPHIIVLDPAKNGFYSTKLESQETFATFLDSITSGVLKITNFARGQDEEHELSKFEQYKLLVEDYITQYLWYTLLGVFIAGIICGQVVFGRKTTKTAKSKKPSTSTTPPKSGKANKQE